MSYKIVEDSKYGYKRIDPIPTQEEVEKYYMEEFYSANNTGFNDSSLEVQEEERVFFENHFRHIEEVCKKCLNKQSIDSLFDVGFGYAQALIYFDKQGTTVSGIEPSKEGADYALEKGFEVFHAGIEDFDVAKGKKYEVVLLLNVLEHLRTPAETLINIKEKLLAPGGVLVIDVPNEFNDFQTVANSEHKLDEWWICPPNHINYFSASSLQNLLEATGYSVTEKESSFPLELFLLFGDVYVGNSELGSQCHNKRVLFEEMMRRHGKEDKMFAFYEALAKLDLGRQVITFSQAT